MKTYYVERTMLGDDATDADAERMVELLQARGYDAETGLALQNTEEAQEAVPATVWDECLDIISREKYA